MRKRLCDDSGATLVEFALSGILFFMILFGTIEFGRGIWQYNMMADLAQEGVRWAAVRGYNNTTTCTGITSVNCKASSAQVQAYVQSRATGLPLTVTTTPAPDSSTAIRGNTISVVVSSTFLPLTSLIPHSSMTLSGTAKMIILR